MSKGGEEIRRIKIGRLVVTASALLAFCGGCISNPIGKENELYSNDEEIIKEDMVLFLDKADQEIDGNQYTGKIEFEGADTIWEYEASENCEVELSYRFSVSSGIAKLVLISPEKEIAVITENTDQSVQKQNILITIQLEKGTNKIKLVAEDKANISLKLSIQAGMLSKIAEQ